MKLRLFTALLLPALPLAAAPDPANAGSANAESAGGGAADAASPAEPAPEPVVREGQVTIDGKAVPYEVTTAKLQLKKKDGTPRASIFHVSYVRSDVDDASGRPVMFAFNGGPGSSAVWLHLGILGPRIISLPGDGTTAPVPPARVVANPHSILDVADLVFVDPVSTGYSRTEKDAKPDEFHGVRGDIESMGDFIRRWITEHKRWESPKFLLGESYGGIRVAGLSEHLQSRYGMSLNGTILLSSLLDFRTLRPGPGDDLIHQVYLPAYTAVAHFHGKLDGDLDELVAAAGEYASGDYLVALARGNAIDPAERRAAAVKLAGFTGLDADLIESLDLRISPSRFRAELLAADDRVVGRFDGRVAWPAVDSATPYPSYDPSYSLAYGAYATAMLSYLGSELGWEEDSPYEILTGEVHPWKWGSENGYVNLSDDLATALRDNPHLRVLVMKGRTDLATPPGGIDHSLRQLLDSPPSALSRIEHVEYAGGHMFYLNPPDLAKARRDLVDFITAEP